MILICLLTVVQGAQNVALFGGGCLVENEKLTISGAFMMQDGAPIKTPSSYQLGLNEKITLPEDNELQWTQVTPGNNLPGDFRNFTYQNNIYPVYILGGLAGRLEDEEQPTETDPSDQFTASYLKALNDGLDVGVLYDDKHILLMNPNTPHDLSTISIVDDEKFTFNPTHGSVPTYRRGFSAARRRNSVYIATSDQVYVFDLKTSTWKSHRVPGLVASRSGCLHLHGTTLIHAFGMVNGSYSSKTLFIDTTNWKLTNKLTPALKPTNPPKTDLTLLVILGFSAAALLVSIAVYGFIRFRRHQNTLPPPEFYTEKIWVTPRISICSLDYTLSSDPASSFEKPLLHSSTSNSLLSSNNIFDY
ncbi:hypothetical protein DSO57_1029365 [Entomophthora muscae]|uniref:Uncharacterized protein n=1 Tax=Entomophthora muscae TaxID=34485 RepID=A0ACC2S3S1_9FUNG|nr:hypothetical protein DSO57_1029365 [Entomophthora muscae]